MPFGILEDRVLEHVPGTGYLQDDTRDVEHRERDPNLKYDPTGKFILVPQPSDDPNDPLNWPRWRRDLILAILSLMAVIASSLSPILAADTLKLSLFYRRTFTDVAILTGWHLLGVGIGGFVFVPSSRIWGKRHAYLLGGVILVISSAWGGASGHNFKSAIASRMFQGIGLAPYEALVNASVGDLFFVHERGVRMAVSNFCVFGGAFLTPVIVGKVSHEMDWPWTFYFVAIFTGFMLPIVFLFVPETAYRRDPSLNTDIGTTLGNKVLHEHNLVDQSQNRNTGAYGDSLEMSTNAELQKELHSPPGSDALKTTEKASWKQSLAIFNGRKTDENFFKLLIRPFPLFFHPSIFWACLIQGTLIGWTVFLGIVLAAIMLGPPLFFNEVKTGYMYTGAFVGALVGFLIAGALSDPTMKWLARKNNGVYEPEFRLILVIPQLVLGCAGLYGFGVTAANTYRYGWFWPDFFFGCEVAGMVVGAVASGLYIVDAYRHISIEAFTCMMVFKNIFSFGLTWSGYDWLVKSGIKKIFYSIASVQVVVCLLTIPLYIYGKRSRSFFARNDILKKIGLD